MPTYIVIVVDSDSRDTLDTFHVVCESADHKTAIELAYEALEGRLEIITEQ